MCCAWLCLADSSEPGCLRPKGHGTKPSHQGPIISCTSSLLPGSPSPCSPVGTSRLMPGWVSHEASFSVWNGDVHIFWFYLSCFLVHFWSIFECVTSWTCDLVTVRLCMKNLLWGWGCILLLTWAGGEMGMVGPAPAVPGQ